MYAVRPPPAAGQGDQTSDEHHRDAPALEVKNVLAGYGRKTNGLPSITVLRDVNVAIERGHSVGSIGESGCGKSTLARVMAGLLPAANGQVLLDGEELIVQERAGREISIRPEMFMCKPLGVATYATAGRLRNLQYRLLRKMDEPQEEKDVTP